MKKSLLLAAAALLLCTSAEARTWTFSNWSSASQDNINADAKWSSDEKGNGTEFAGCYWYKAGSLTEACDENGNLLANGVVLKELEGLKFTTYGSGWAAIGTDYQVTKDANAWGPYNGAQYFWLANKGLRITIPAVAPGTVIKAGLESHKPSDARGIDLYVGDTKIAWVSGQDTYPTTYSDYEWVVPEDLEAETVDVEIRPTNGCHLYYIEVQEGDVVLEDKTVAYVYDSSYGTNNGYGYTTNGGLDTDPVFAVLDGSYTAVAIDVNGQTLTPTELNDSLINFDVVVLSEAVGSGNSYAKAMKDIINFVPMLNLKSFMYKNGVWGVGAGSNPSPKATSIVVKEDYLDSQLFEGVDVAEDGTVVLFNTEDVTALAGGNLVQGYTTSAGSMFENDEVIATVGNGINAIHIHGTRNQYMLIPISSDNLIADGDYNLNENATTLISNAIAMLATTKSKVQNAAKPIISQAAANGVTTVTLTCSTAGSSIYYTLDGTEPTEASTKYAEPFDVTTDGVVVKAFATAQGYNPSDVAEAAIVVKTQAAAPQIAAVQEEGKTTITLTAEEGDQIYFSFNGIQTVAGSQLYTEPVVLTEPATITALASSADKLASATVSAELTVAGIPAVKDTLAHFTANEADWFTNVVIYDYQMEAQPTPESNYAAKAAYYWGKSAWSYYSDEVDHTEPVLDETGAPVQDMNGQDSVKVVYKADPTAMKYVYSTTDTQWRLRSQGQVFTGETNVAAEYTVAAEGAAGYFAETALDLIGQPSKGKLTFGGKGSGEPYSAGVESLVKFTAPFDIVTYTTNGGGSNFNVEIQTSADGENWTAVGTLPVASTQRYYKKGRCHVDGTEELYVRVLQVGGSTKAQLYDIYVVSTEGMTGIESVAEGASQRETAIFDLQGRQVNTMVPGQIYIQNGKKLIVR